MFPLNFAGKLNSSCWAHLFSLLLVTVRRSRMTPSALCLEMSGKFISFIFHVTTGDRITKLFNIMRVPLSLASNIFFFCLNHPQQPCLSPTVNVLGVCFNSTPLLSTRICASCLLPHNNPKFHSVKQPFSYAHRLCRLAGFRQWLQEWPLMLMMSGTSAGKTSRLRATQRLGAGVS